MALTKTGYRDAQRGTTKVTIPIDEDGNINPLGDKTKQFNLSLVNANNGLEENTQILTYLLKLAGLNSGGYHGTNTMSVKWEE